MPTATFSLIACPARLSDVVLCHAAKLHDIRARRTRGSTLHPVNHHLRTLSHPPSHPNVEHSLYCYLVLKLQLSINIQQCLESVRKTSKEGSSCPPTRRSTPVLQLSCRHSRRASRTIPEPQSVSKRRGKVDKMARSDSECPLCLL